MMNFFIYRITLKNKKTLFFEDNGYTFFNSDGEETNFKKASSVFLNGKWYQLFGRPQFKENFKIEETVICEEFSISQALCLILNEYSK